MTFLPVPTAPETTLLTPISIIRTETVLSRLPIHNLSKTRKIDIRIVRRNPAGAVKLHWEVSYNAKYGQPGPLAYKLDSLVVNRRLDEQPRPLPRILRIGSLNQVCNELGLSASGREIHHVKTAILQNAGALITAKLNYRTTQGAERRLEAVFTRYSVVFTGEQLPDGRRADGVYILFTEPYWEVLNHAPVRPLDYGYLKQLAPTPQRFYEILSYRMYAALKHQLPHARLAYSEYCLCSTQKRYTDYDHFKKQMHKVHRPHLESGYIRKVSYQAAFDEEGQPDWIMLYEPGPKARAEYQTFTDRRGLPEQFELFQSEPAEEIPPEESSPTLFQQLVMRGISPLEAQKMLRQVSNESLALEQLEWGDYLISQASPRKFYNPPGFYVYLLREGILPPPQFETRRMKAARQAAQQQQDRAAEQRLWQELAYKDYVRAEVENYIRQPECGPQYQQLVEKKRNELLKQYRSLSLCGSETLQELAHSAAAAEIAHALPLLSFEQFCRQRMT